MIQNDGLDCAVNLFGAASDLPWADREEEEFSQIAGNVVSLEETLPSGEVQMDVFRINRSLDDMGLGPDTEEWDAAVLQERVRRLLGLLAQKLSPLTEDIRIALSSADKSSRFTPEVTADIAWSAFATLLGPESLEKVAGEFTDFMGTIGERTAHHDEALQSAYAGFAGRGRETPGRGPLVEAGLMDEKEWHALASESLDRRVESLVPVLRSDEMLNWLE